MYLTNNEFMGDSLTVDDFHFQWSLLDELKAELEKVVQSNVHHLFIGRRERHYLVVVFDQTMNSALELEISFRLNDFFDRFFIGWVKTEDGSFSHLNDKTIELKQLKEILNTLI